jgi:hypothetical protein
MHEFSTTITTAPSEFIKYISSTQHNTTPHIYTIAAPATAAINTTQIDTITTGQHQFSTCYQCPYRRAHQIEDHSDCRSRQSTDHQ